MKCPCCNGEGGEQDIILYHGIGGGPWYECLWCKGNRRVGFFKWLFWRYCEGVYWPIQKKLHEFLSHM